MTATILKQDPNIKGLKKKEKHMLISYDKTYMQIFMVSPFFKQQSNT